MKIFKIFLFLVVLLLVLFMLAVGYVQYRAFAAIEYKAVQDILWISFVGFGVASSVVVFVEVVLFCCEKEEE